MTDEQARLLWRLEAVDNASSTFRSVGSSADSLGAKFGNLAKSLAKWGAAAAAAAAAFAMYKGIQLLKDSVEEASKLGESINAVRVTWGKAAKDILKQSKLAADGLGLSRSEFNMVAVQFEAFASTIAGEGGDVSETFDDLVTRGADFASVMNLEVNEALRLFQSGLAGETEPLRKFGIDLSAAAVTQYALKKGIAESALEMTEAQKVQARYALLMKQTDKTAGDFKNTQDSLANGSRRLGALWKDLKADIGKSLKKPLEGLVAWANETLIPWIREDLLPAWRKFVKWIKEEAVPWIGEKLRGALDRVKEWWNNGGKEAVAGLWEQAKKAWENIKELAKQVYELVINLSGGKEGDPAAEGMDGLAESAGTVATEVSTAAEALAEFIEKLNWLIEKVQLIDEVAGALNRVGMAVATLGLSEVYRAEQGSADGGYLKRRGMGGWTIVGEHGPELINNRGYVKTHSQTMGMQGGGNVIHIHGAIDPVNTARQIERILAKGGRVSGGIGLATA